MCLDSRLGEACHSEKVSLFESTEPAGLTHLTNAWWVTGASPTTTGKLNS